MKRGRPKGQSNDQRSYGPLGDLLRRNRLSRKLGLAEVARACQCSIQFISNIEHGRAPLPWDKVPLIASFLKIPVDQVRAANLSVRSDFKTFVTAGTDGVRPNASAEMLAAALSARDKNFRTLIARYQSATPASRRKFFKAAMELLDSRP